MTAECLDHTNIELMSPGTGLPKGIPDLSTAALEFALALIHTAGASCLVSWEGARPSILFLVSARSGYLEQNNTELDQRL